MTSNFIYDSIFKEEIQELIEWKRSIGHKYITEAGQLRRLDNFFVVKGLTTKKIDKPLVDEWCSKRSYEAPANHANRISIMRIFCSYLVDIGIQAYIPPKGMVGHPPKYNAHIYTDDELKRFFEATDRCKEVPGMCPYRHLVMPIFFRILYTSGLRVSELRTAKIKDFDFDKEILIVRYGKNQKSRIVPIHPTLVDACVQLKESIHKHSDENEYFFMHRPGQPMSLGNVYKNFRRFLEKANIPHTGKGPRVHDFRHTFCINLLKKWVEEEKDLMAYLPYMRTMLGHESYEETAYYLKLTAELFPNLIIKLETTYPNMIKLETNHEEYY